SHVRKYKPSVAEGEVARMFGGGGEGGDESPFEPAVAGPDRSRLIAEFLYPDCSPEDQLLLEHAFGLRGAERLAGRELAAKLNVSPAAVSQRAARLQARL